jgi:hypothetical protein
LNDLLLSDMLDFKILDGDVFRLDIFCIVDKLLHKKTQ